MVDRILFSLTNPGPEGTQRSPGDAVSWRKGTGQDLQRYGGEKPSFQRDDEAKPKQPVDEQVLRASLDKLEKVSSLFNRHLRFEMIKEADLLQVSVIDSSSQEVIRKIPPDEVVKLIEQVDQFLGVLFDKKA